MSQERPFGNSGAEHHPEPNHSQPTEEVTTAAPTPNHFWRMMIDPGFPSPASSLTLFVVTAEAFLGLTSQVKALTGMVQTIAPYLPQLIQSATHQSAPPTAFPFFWSLIERPPTTLPEMLQRAHQYMVAETLVAGKQDEEKRPRVE
ncbi:hypothetical protein BHM03_00032992 [Ensete ventricosum]|nr:hypothetical protein BHM03_00032992 [Ensete ventricosum]